MNLELKILLKGDIWKVDKENIINDALSKSQSGVLPREWIGLDSQGVMWRGYFENGKLISFFPE